MHKTHSHRQVNSVNYRAGTDGSYTVIQLMISAGVLRLSKGRPVEVPVSTLEDMRVQHRSSPGATARALLQVML